MSDTADSARLRKIVSIDGAGVYGLVSALWLRQLCEKDPDFLTRGQVDLFAGISSGALNALLLAKYEVPREAVLAGELEAFWTEPRGVFSNSNPLGVLLSFYGLTPWYDEAEFRAQLERYFGSLTLGELPNKVLVSTFNWTGRHEIDFSSGNLIAWPGGPGSERRFWRPKFFCTLRPDKDDRYRVADVAYGAAAPPGLRPIRGGIGDAGTFTGNPSTEAIAAMARALEGWKPIEEDAGFPHQPQEPLPPGTPMRHLDELALISIGDGNCIPSFWLDNYALGLIPLAMLPTNPFTGNWFSSPWQVSIQGPELEAAYVSRTLLLDRYHRLDGRLLETPMLLASLMARSTFWRHQLFGRIFQAARSEKSQRLIGAAAAFLRNGWQEPWERGEAPAGAPATPPPS